MVWGTCLADDFLFQVGRTGAARWTLDAVAELADVDLQLRNRSAERIAMHAQFPCRAALVSFVLVEHGQNEAFLEFTHALGIKNIASVHLQDECFQLIFHDESLFAQEFSLRRLSGRGSRAR